MEMVQKICPRPQQWDKIYQVLNKKWQNQGSEGEAPPTPLILAGWNYSTDFQKKERWEKTVRWAKEYGLEEVIKDLSEEDFYTSNI